MTNTSVRAAKPEDAQLYFDWLKQASDINLVDTAVYDYPCCMTLVVEKRGSAELMNSVHPVLMMEALAPKPGITPLQEAKALKQLFDTIKQIAAQTGVKEIWFGCKDERLAKFVEGRGFERVSFPMFRAKV